MDAHPAYAIARATETDIDGILDLLTDVAAEELWIATELPIDRPKRKLGIQTTLARADALILVAVADGNVVGQLTLFPLRPGLLSLGMIVAEDWRSKGVGSALLSRSIEWARDANAYKIALDVFPHNPAAIALYEKHGFAREGLHRGHLRRKSGELWDLLPMGLLLGKSPD